MTTELTPAQREHRWTQARNAIAHAMYDTYGQQDTDRSNRIADRAMDALADVAADILTDGTMLKGLHMENGVATLDIEPAREILLTLVASMRTMLDHHGAHNYLETEITAPSISLDLRDGQNPRDAYTVTIQRRQRPTPHEFRQQAEARVAELERELAQAQADAQQHITAFQALARQAGLAVEPVQNQCTAEYGGAGYTRCELPADHDGRHDSALGNLRRATWGGNADA